jgi:hypothetical protein
MADDDNSERSFSANSDDEGYDEEEEVDRDEVKEVRKLSSKDTTRIRCWRLVVTLVLLLTAFAVTFTTYTFLQRQEHKNFVTAVSNVIYFLSIRQFDSIQHTTIKNTMLHATMSYVSHNHVYFYEL